MLIKININNTTKINIKTNLKIKIKYRLEDFSFGRPSEKYNYSDFFTQNIVFRTLHNKQNIYKIRHKNIKEM